MARLQAHQPSPNNPMKKYLKAESMPHLTPEDKKKFEENGKPTQWDIAWNEGYRCGKEEVIKEVEKCVPAFIEGSNTEYCEGSNDCREAFLDMLQKLKKSSKT